MTKQNGFLVFVDGYVEPYECSFCFKPATNICEYEGKVYFLCNVCNKFMSTVVETNKLSIVIEGGKNG